MLVFSVTEEAKNLFAGLVRSAPPRVCEKSKKVAWLSRMAFDFPPMSKNIKNEHKTHGLSWGLDRCFKRSIMGAVNVSGREAGYRGQKLK